MIPCCPIAEEFSKFLMKNITSSLQDRSETDTAIFTLAEKISLEELLGPDTEIFSWKHLKKIRNPYREPKEEILEQRAPNASQIYQLFLSLILLLSPAIHFISDLQLVIDHRPVLKHSKDDLCSKVKLTNLEIDGSDCFPTYRNMDMTLLKISILHLTRHRSGQCRQKIF